jgi:hypothetical protein
LFGFGFERHGSKLAKSSEGLYVRACFRGEAVEDLSSLRRGGIAEIAEMDWVDRWVCAID